MNVFPSGDVGDVPAANAQPVVDGSENVKGVPTSLTDLGFSSEFERQLQLENDPELKFISLHELDNDDVFLALHDIIVTPNTNMAYGHVDNEMTVMDSTPNMVHSHVFSSGENPPFNFGYDQFFSSADKGKGVVVDETPSHNFVLDHVGPYKEREVVTPTLDMANVDYDFPFEEMGDDQSQELQPPSVLFTTDLKPRLRWTFELHQCFLKAVNDLGGPKKACPKDILNSMKVEGLTLYHVKSHLQKYRQNPDSVSQWCEMNQNVQSSLGSQVPQGSSSSLGSSSLGENLSSYDNNKGKSKVGEGSASGLYAPVEPANISTRFQEAQSNYLNNSLRNAQRMLSYPYYGYGGATIGNGSYYGHDFNTMGRVPTLYQNLINSYNTYYGMDAYRQPTVSFPAAPFPTSPSLGYTRGSFSPYSQVPRNFYQESSRNLYQETFRNLYQERLRNLYQEGFSANPGRANKRARTSGI